METAILGELCKKSMGLAKKYKLCNFGGLTKKGGKKAYQKAEKSQEALKSWSLGERQRWKGKSGERKEKEGRRR